MFFKKTKFWVDPPPLSEFGFPLFLKVLVKIVVTIKFLTKEEQTYLLTDGQPLRGLRSLI